MVDDGYLSTKIPFTHAAFFLFRRILPSLQSREGLALRDVCFFCLLGTLARQIEKVPVLEPRVAAR